MSSTVPPKESYRERHRRRRRQEFLDTALRIVLTEGLGALTMRRITEELECSEASIYVYFASKGELISQLQVEALGTLGRSLAVSQAELDRRVAGRPGDFVALARVVAASRFWVAAETMFPREIELCRLLFGSWTPVLADDEVRSVVSPALQLVGFGDALMAAAADAGALDPGDAYERAAVMLAGTTGVLLAGGLSHRDPRLAPARSWADRMVTVLLLGWGASPAALAEADAIVGEMARVGELVPPDPGTP